ncbi:MAG: hypothetical protein LBV44_05510, partial [Methylobacillus sp.]|nr:hypothetical protein [Methylobacillus sp.]
MNANRFKRIFSKRLGMLIAVGEQTKTQGKEPGQGDTAGVLPLAGEGWGEGMNIIAKLA